jgi:hypothetical protein
MRIAARLGAAGVRVACANSQNSTRPKNRKKRFHIETFHLFTGR